MRAAWVIVLALAALRAAQAAAEISPAPSEALRCMTPPESERGVPEYDELALQRKEGGLVRVDLTFTAPDRAPGVRVIEPVAPGLLVESVRKHVRRLRVPCMTSHSPPVHIVQDYLFVPNDGRKVVASTPQDSAAAERWRQAACLMRITPGVRPEYPERARRHDEEGRFLVRLRFASPTEAPQWTFVAAAPAPNLRAAVEAFLPGFRLPCQSGEPVEVDITFIFRVEGSERVVIKDQPLLTLVRSAESMQRPVYFDLKTMGCPFDVRIKYFQPFKPNRVAELEQSRPERRLFLDWLSTIKIRAPEATQLAVLGDEFTVRVPCGTVNL